jgi:hypothetical protein
MTVCGAHGAPYFLVLFLGFKPRCSDAEQKAWSREKAPRCLSPDISGRVRAAAVNMFFVREAEGRVAGRRFLGITFL